MKRCAGVFTALLLVCAASWAQETIRIGAFLSVTGPNSPLGTPERDTLVMLQEVINEKGGVLGKKLEVIVEDDASLPSSALTAANKLINQDKVVALIGGSGTGTTMAVVPVTEANGMPHISCAAGIAITTPSKEEQEQGKGKVRKNIFRTPQTDRVAVSRIFKHLQKKKISSIALIYDSNPFGTSGKAQIEALAPAYGIEVKAMESFKSNDTDMTAQLVKIRNSGAKAIVCWGTNPGPAIVTKNVRQLKINLPVYQSHGIANRKFIELAGKAADGVIFPAGKLIVVDELKKDDPQKPVLEAYRRDFIAKYRREPDTFGGHAWDALYLLVNAMERAGTTDAAKVVAALEQTRGFVGIGGIFNYSPEDHDGLDESAFALVTIKGGRWVVLQD